MNFSQLLDHRFWIRTEPWPKQALKLPRLQAHRGYWVDGEKENTIGALRVARSRGALMFECDLRLSKDQVPVLFHDVDLRRMAGLDRLVSEMTAQELRQKCHVPTLEEVLLDPQVPRLCNLELKSKVVIDDPLERRVAQVVSRCKAESRVLFSSFNPMSLYRISHYLPQVPRAFIATNENEEDNSAFLRRLLAPHLFSFHMLNLDHRMVNGEVVRMFKRHKVPVAVWTVNDPHEIQKFLEWGCVSVITDSLGL